MINEFTEKLFTPKELAEAKILSLVQQWKERKSGRLNCYRIGKKILYSEQHLAKYFASCDSTQSPTVQVDEEGSK